MFLMLAAFAFGVLLEAALANPAPTLVWARTYANPSGSGVDATGVAVDSAGNIIVVGHEDRTDLGEWYNWRILKYDPDGNILWTRTHNGPSSTGDFARGVAVDSADSIFVVGSETRPLTNGDWLIRKYDSNGNLLWGKSHNGSGNEHDDALAVAIDPSGTAIVVGYERAASEDWRIAKYDTDGNLLWSAVAGSPWHESAYDVAVDSTGDFVVAGTIAPANNDWLVHKYSRAGTLLWTRTFASPGIQDDDALGIAVDLTGSIYVAGFEEQGSVFVDKAWRTHKYSTDGNLVWSRTYNGPNPNQRDSATDVELDATGNPIVVGFESRGDIGEHRNWLVIRYDKGGTATWSVSYTSSGGWPDTARRIATTPQGQFVVVGTSSTDPFLTDMMIRKYDQRANLLAQLQVVPGQVSTGQQLLIVLTVTNQGCAAANTVDTAGFQLTGAGNASYLSGPSPPLPATLAGGSAITFTWTYTGSSAGTVSFSTTITGIDTATGSPIQSGPVTSNATLIQTPPSLVASLASLSSTTCVADLAVVTLTVTNTGQAAAVSLQASPLLLQGTGGLSLVSGPFPSMPSTLSGGSISVFTWTYTGAATGIVRATTTVTGTDINSGAGVGTGPIVSGTVFVIAGPSLLPSATTADTASIGQWFTVELTVTNTGDVPATGVSPTIQAGPGTLLVVQETGPLPLGPLDIPPGNTVTFVWTYSVSGAGNVWFTATASGTGPCGTVQGTATTGTATQAPPVLTAIDMTAFPSPACVGTLANIVATISNTGGAQAINVSASSSLSLEGTGTASLVSGPAGLLSLDPGSSTALSWTYSVTSAGTLTFTATVTAKDVNSGYQVSSGPISSNSLSAISPPCGPLLSLTKTAFGSRAVEGCPVTYTVSMTNIGAATAANIVVWDSIPMGAAYVASGGAPSSFDGAKVAWTVPDLLSGQSAAVTLTVSPAATNTNFAQVSYTALDFTAQPVVASNSVNMTVVAEPDLSLTIATPKTQFSSEELVVYTITCYNTGEDTAQNVVLWDSLPSAATYVSNSPGGIFDGTKVVWTVPDIPPAGNSAVQMTVRANGGCASSSLSNTAWAGGQSTCGLAVQASTTVHTASVINASLSLVKSANPMSVPQGGTVSYALAYANTCSDDALNVSIWDTVPAGTAFLSATAGGLLSGNLVFWTLPTVPAGSSGNVAFTVSATAAPVPNIATIRCSNSASIWQQDTVSNPVQVTLRAPVLVLQKRALEPTQSGEPVTFELSLSNAGTDTAADVVVVDTLPPPLSFVSATGPYTVSGSTVTWNLGIVPPNGSSITLQVTGRGPREHNERTVTNTAHATFTNSTGQIALEVYANATTVLSAELGIPRVFPLPYNPSSAVRGTLKFTQLPEGSVVTILTVKGVTVRKLTAGAEQLVEWDGRNSNGAAVAAGIYLYTIEIGGDSKEKKLFTGRFGVIR